MTISEEEKKIPTENEETVNFDLFKHEFDNQELESLASSLAPRVTELLSENALDVLLDSYTNDEIYAKQSKNESESYVTDSDDEEDGINSEWKRLRAAEESLREELEMSTEYGLSLFYHNFGDASNDDGGHDPRSGEENPVEKEKNHMKYSGNLLEGAVAIESYANDEKEFQSKVKIKKAQYRNNSSVDPMKTPSKRKKEKYTLFDHADHLLVNYDSMDLHYPTCPMMTREEVEGILAMPNFRIQNPTMTNISDSNNHSFDEYGQMKLFTGEGFGYDTMEQCNNPSPNSSFLEDENPTEAFPQMKTTNEILSDISIEQREQIVEDILSCTREYVRPLPQSVLKKIYAGIVENKRLRRRRKKGRGNDDESVNSANEKDSPREPLPIRTCLIRIRPDVLCGAVMDAVNTTIETLGGEMIKRQGGHLRAVIPGTASSVEGTKSSHKWSPFSSTYKKAVVEQGLALPPFVIDVQLVTRKKSRDAERILLLRGFSVTQGEVVFPDDGAVDVPIPVDDSIQNLAVDVSIQKNFHDSAENDNLIQEAAALVQRIGVVGGDAVVGNDKLPDIMETPTKGVMSESQDGIHMSSGILGYLPTGTWLSPILTETNETHQIKNPSSKLINTPLSANKNSIEENRRSSVTETILSHAEPTPSVNKVDKSIHNIPSPDGKLLNHDHEPIPALSKEDWPFVQSSSRFMRQCLDELENRDLAYSTMVSCPFGAFPALPTLDVHYCSQIKLVSKENMVKSLLKAASELEQFARESEYSCAVMVKLMKSTFYAYDIEAPDLPHPVPLTAYPLDFQPPENSCPPWGQRVLEALNYVAKSSSSENAVNTSDTLNENFVAPVCTDTKVDNTSNNNEISSISLDKKPDFYRATDAVNMVSSAFQRQFDEEQSARLGRKNMQVMDRLAKMLAHKRSCISRIRDSYGRNEHATRAADEFHYYAQKYFSKSEHELQPYYAAEEQIPLLTFRILLGSSTGTCYITANQMLLVTQSIPILGGHTYHLVPLAEIELEVLPPSTSILNPLPAGLKIRRNYREKESLFSFVPSISAKLLKIFVESLQVVLSESPEALNFSEKGGLLYIYDENQSVAKAALGASMT